MKLDISLSRVRYELQSYGTAELNFEQRASMVLLLYLYKVSDFSIGYVFIRYVVLKKKWQRT